MKKLRKSHGIYLRNLKLGKPFPIEWVLECTAKMKTPFIIVQPPSIDYPYQDFLLEETARAFGEYYIPIFVEFYPDPQQYGNSKNIRSFLIKQEIFLINTHLMLLLYGVLITKI